MGAGVPERLILPPGAGFGDLPKRRADDRSARFPTGINGCKAILVRLRGGEGGKVRAIRDARQSPRQARVRRVVEKVTRAGEARERAGKVRQGTAGESAGFVANGLNVNRVELGVQMVGQGGVAPQQNGVEGEFDEDVGQKKHARRRSRKRSCAQSNGNVGHCLVEGGRAVKGAVGGKVQARPTGKIARRARKVNGAQPPAAGWLHRKKVGQHVADVERGRRVFPFGEPGNVMV